MGLTKKISMQWAARARGAGAARHNEPAHAPPPPPPLGAAGAPRRPSRPARPCPGGAPIENNGRFRWAVEGFWGLQTGYGVESRPSR
jgi:hypothetical protein